MLELEEPLSKMKIIHVAGTKGKVLDLLFRKDFLLYFVLCISISFFLFLNDMLFKM